VEQHRSRPQLKNTREYRCVASGWQVLNLAPTRAALSENRVRSGVVLKARAQAKETSKDRQKEKGAKTGIGNTSVGAAAYARQITLLTEYRAALIH